MTTAPRTSHIQQRNARSKTSPIKEDDEAGKPLVEIALQDFNICLHRDRQLGPIIILEDDYDYDGIKQLEGDSLGGMLTLATWQRLKLLVLSGVVDQLLKQA